MSVNCSWFILSKTNITFNV